MGDRLAHREEALLHVELAREQHGDELGRAQRRRGRRIGIDELGEPRVVMRAQLRDAQRDAAERQPVRGQHQRVGRQRAKGRERIEEARERIAVRLDRPDADVGADLRQQHVAGDQHAALAGVERRVFGRVAVAFDDAPRRSPPARSLSPSSRRSKRSGSSGTPRR